MNCKTCSSPITTGSVGKCYCGAIDRCNKCYKANIIKCPMCNIDTITSSCSNQCKKACEDFLKTKCLQCVECDTIISCVWGHLFTKPRSTKFYFTTYNGVICERCAKAKL